MPVQLTFQGSVDHNNTRGLMFKATFTGNYGVNGVGDLLNLTPSQAVGDGGILDPNLAYDLILEQPPKSFGVLNEDIGGSYVAIHPNANPTLKNFGLIMYEPGGAEKATAAAYTAGELAGSCLLIFFVSLQ